MASGPYAEVAVAVKQHVRVHPDAAILIFDDQVRREIDFDLRGSDRDIADRVAKQFSAAAEPARAAGRPKLGVVSREVTLLPRHWEWLAAQQGGASATLRRLVENASRASGDDRTVLRQLQERTYRFMSAMAGNLPGFAGSLARAVRRQDCRHGNAHGGLAGRCQRARPAAVRRRTGAGVSAA